MTELHSLISSFSYIAIFVLMFTNGVINFPSSQFLYLVCGYFISTGHLVFASTVIVGTLGNTLGNITAFLLIKKYGEPFARKLFMLDEAKFKKIYSALHSTFEDKGMIWLLLGKITPSIKAFIPMIAGLAKTEPKITSLIFFVGSLIWAIIVTSIGYFFGEHISLTSLTAVSLTVGTIIIFVVYKKVYKKIN